ncbi:phosphopantetheine-binding protein [Actinomadura sp. WMMA1423]|uniref:phosphopantetheine-binding protein n=1 Tax=Actinomadura sp. WMMA1423 TaxID=2591108 RepID=UPI001146DD74
MWDNRFEELLRRQLPFLAPEESLAPDAALGDLGLDSLGTVELLASLESAYGVRFVDDSLRPETFASAGVLWRTLTGVVAETA